MGYKAYYPKVPNRAHNKYPFTLHYITLHYNVKVKFFSVSINSINIMAYNMLNLLQACVQGNKMSDFIHFNPLTATTRDPGIIFLQNGASTRGTG